MENERGIDRTRETILHNKELIKHIMIESGFTHVEHVEELALTPDQIKQIRFGRPENEGVAFYSATRNDGETVVALIKALASRYIAGDIFSPAFVGGHTEASDLLDDELKQLLKEALERTEKTS